MPTAVIRIDVNPVLQLGPLAIHWYGIMYAIAFYAGWRFAVRPFLRSHAVADADIERMLAWVILFGLLGARLYYVVQQDLGSYLRHPVDIIAVWNGGMAFFGAIIAGLLTIAVLAWRNRLSMWMLMDAGVLFAVVGQPIGRIGNIINGDILGSQSNLPWATTYTYVTGQTADGPHCAVLQGNASCGVAYQPAAAYEAIGTILIGLVLLALLRRRVAAGVLTITYVALYAVSQLVVFQWRDSEPSVGLGLKQAQWTAIVVLVVAVPLLVALYRRGVGAFDRRPPATAEGGPSDDRGLVEPSGGGHGDAAGSDGPAQARGVEPAAPEASPGGTG